MMSHHKGHKNGESVGNNSRRMVEDIAKSEFVAGLARIFTIVMTGLVFPIVVGLVIWSFSITSKKEEQQAAIDKAQTEALQSISSTLILLEYRLGQEENESKSMDIRLDSTNARLRALERTIPSHSGEPSYRQN